MDLTTYAQVSAQILELSIPPEYLSGVVENLERMQALAQLLTEFPLPDDLEAAPQFQP